MTLSTWWNSDTLPLLQPLPAFTVSQGVDEAALAQLNRLSLDEVQARRAAGHHPYLALLQGTPVSYGWVATRQASIGELGLTFSLPAGNRYLWDFATLPDWQGQGIYPRLLQGILRAERQWARRFWILHAPENLPSGVGIRRAGLLPVGELSFDASGVVTLVPASNTERAEAATRMLQVPLVYSALAPCWRCGNSNSSCGCHTAIAQAGSCACAVALKSTTSKAA